MDEDGDGELSHDEFQQVMAAMRALHPQGRQVRDKNVLGASLGRLETGGQLEDFFGEDGAPALFCCWFAALTLFHFFCSRTGTKKLSAKDFEKYVRKVQVSVRLSRVCGGSISCAALLLVPRFDLACLLLLNVLLSACGSRARVRPM
jgi:hypothetical protein